jgi:hypothetical protein
VPGLEQQRGAADHAAQRVLGQHHAEPGGALDSLGQPGEQRPAAGQPHLTAHDLLGQARRYVGHEFTHADADPLDQRVECVRHQVTADPFDPRCAGGGVDADRLCPPVDAAGQAERRLELAGGTLAEDEAQFIAGMPRDRLIHRVTRDPQRPGAHDLPAGHRGDLGRAAADVHHEAARAARQVNPAAGRRCDGFVDQVCLVARSLRADRGHHRLAFHEGGAARHRHQDAGRADPAQHPAQETMEHGDRGVQVRDHSITERVNHIDTPWLLFVQDVSGAADRGEPAVAGVDRDRRRLLQHHAFPRYPDQRVDRPEIDGHARPETHDAHPLHRHSVNGPSMDVAMVIRRAVRRRQ